MKRKLLRGLLLLLALLLAGSYGLSGALRLGWARRVLLDRLSSGFGRPVEAASFGFSLLPAPRLEAQSVTVAEDPRFGQEYFLRAEQLTARVRWSALLQGRFEFDTVSLTRPSLNLVRLSDGRWNIENWLPPLPTSKPSAASRALSTTPSPATAAARVLRLEVQDGRINFKRDVRKLPLAFVAVTGRFDHDASGHWNIDVQANPLRASSLLQQAGTLRVRGTIGGVSARLRPARLAISWQAGALADLSRLLQRADYGIRGTFDANLTAQIEDAPATAGALGPWTLQGKIRLLGVHGWALAGREDNPTVNFLFDAQWTPAEARLRFSRYQIEARQSQILGTLDFDWARGFRPQLQLASYRISLADLLAWRRAFHAGVSDELTAEGAIQGSAAFSGWPARADAIAVSSDGFSLRVPGVPALLRAGPIVTEWSGGMLRLRKTAVLLPVPPIVATSVRGNRGSAQPSATSTISVDASFGPQGSSVSLVDAPYRVSMSGAVPRAQDLVAFSRAWGSSPAWSVAGPLSVQLFLSGTFRPRASSLTGTIEARDVELTSPLVNRPLAIAAANVDLRAGQRRITLQSAQGFGGRWSGTLQKLSPDRGWEFDLSSDRLDAADFSAWLGAQDRPNLLERVLPFAGNSARAGGLADVAAAGRLRVAELDLARLRVLNIDTSSKITGSTLTLRQAHAEIFGAQWSGDVVADLSAEPAYSLDGQFSRLDLSQLAEIFALPGRASGTAAGELKLHAGGASLAALAASLQGQGTLRAPVASLRALEFDPSLAASEAPAEDRPAAIAARFHIGAGSLNLDSLQFARQAERTDVSGKIDFARHLDLRVTPQPRASAVGGAFAPSLVSGTLDAPRIVSPPAVSPAQRAVPQSTIANR